MAQTDSNENSSTSIGPAADKHANGERRRMVIIGGAVLLILALVYGIFCLMHALSYESTDDAFVDGSVVRISPRVGGYVEQILVGDNQWVNAGDTLLILDPLDFKARHDGARANLEATRSAAVAAAALVKTAEAQAAAAASLRDQAQAQLELSRASQAEARAESASNMAEHERDAMDLGRAREMAKNGTITDQDLDHAIATERMSAADLESAERKIDTQKAGVRQAGAALSVTEENQRQARAQIDVRRAQETQARADIDRAAAELEQAALQLSYTRIVSPVDGYVTRKAVEKGAFVQMGQALMAIVRPNVWVTANFKETQLTKMRPGQPATITVDTFSGKAFTGRVDSIQRGTGAAFSLLPPENATGNFIKVVQRVPVKIIFDRSEQLGRYSLFPGLSAHPEVDITTLEATGAPTARDDNASVAAATTKGTGSAK